MAGTLTSLLTDNQYKWLLNNMYVWYNVPNTTVQIDNGTLRVIQLTPVTGRYLTYIYYVDDTISFGGQNTGSTWDNRYNGVAGTGSVIYANHDPLIVDSYTTIGIPTYSKVRIDYDIENVIKIKETLWTWENLYNILANLSDIEAIPTTANDQQNIAYEWDSLMANRYVSPYLYQWVKGNIDEVHIAEYLTATFGDKWNKMYDVMTEEYNPLDNYNMHETEHLDDIKDESTTGSSSASSSYEDASESSNSGTNDVTVTDQVYGFDSSTAADAAKNVTDGETSGSGSTSSDGSSSSEGESSSTYTTDNDKDRELTRAGNIGVTTSQQLIQAELELRKTIVLNTIRDDIVSVLTLPYYDARY